MLGLAHYKFKQIVKWLANASTSSAQGNTVKP